MTIKVMTTKEMDRATKEAVCRLFKNVFDMEKSYDDFVYQFEDNELGYSYFGLMFDGDSIVGSYAAIPFRYIYNGAELVFAQSVDTMIEENYRGNPFLLKKLSEKVYKKMQEDGVPFVFGFPNDNIYIVRKKVLKWIDIYNLDIYILPIKIGAIKKPLAPLNFLSNGFASIVNMLVNKNKNLSNLEDFSIYKEMSSAFEQHRFTKEYMRINITDNAYAYYRLQVLQGIRTAFIVDVYPLTKMHIEISVKKIYEREKSIDLIVYFGYLPFSPINLLKLPERYKPKDTFMSGRILNKELISKDVFEIKRWRVNLSNLDWI